jgi:hypothetical protein
MYLIDFRHRLYLESGQEVAYDGIDRNWTTARL